MHGPRRGGPPETSSAKAASSKAEVVEAPLQDVSGLAGFAGPRTRVRAPVISTTHQFVRPASLEPSRLRNQGLNAGERTQVRASPSHTRDVAQGKVRHPARGFTRSKRSGACRANPSPSRDAGHRSSATSANTGGCPADVVRCRAGVLFFFCGAAAHLRHSRTARAASAAPDAPRATPPELLNR